MITHAVEEDELPSIDDDALVLDRNRMNTHKHLSQLIELAIDHDIPTPV